MVMANSCRPHRTVTVDQVLPRSHASCSDGYGATREGRTAATQPLGVQREFVGTTAKLTRFVVAPTREALHQTAPALQQRIQTCKGLRHQGVDKFETAGRCHRARPWTERAG